jgi:hypothetical protein
MGVDIKLKLTRGKYMGRFDRLLESERVCVVEQAGHASQYCTGGVCWCLLMSFAVVDDVDVDPLTWLVGLLWCCRLLVVGCCRLSLAGFASLQGLPRELASAKETFFAMYYNNKFTEENKNE